MCNTCYFVIIFESAESKNQIFDLQYYITVKLKDGKFCSERFPGFGITVFHKLIHYQLFENDRLALFSPG